MVVEESRLQSILDGIPLTPPWTVGEFTAYLSERFDKRIILDPWRVHVPAVSRCGALWVTNNELVIKYDPARSARGQRQEIMHEIGHVLLEHRGDNRFEITDSLLAEGLDPQRVREILHRRHFDSTAEWEAEWLGTHLAGLSRGRPDDLDGAGHRAASLVELMWR
ncbi:ImmA/IrrE family metallo-endopeptidase [Nocardia carnea]|uniref:ImmA/IrrE family metallo-endopeptidase n=1 Tax=Nocardia carnea TaxID=37328 RepID=UPI002455C0FB|nr:ImmA/IrrE family metallo-endopeptidase [Nocardia carnea]